jgi:hypothetical protein
MKPNSAATRRPTLAIATSAKGRKKVSRTRVPLVCNQLSRTEGMVGSE